MILNRIKWIAVAGVLLTVASVPSEAQRWPSSPTPSTAAQWPTDSARFVRDSTNWVRDSIVIDSLSRRVKTDSLYRLYRTMLGAADRPPIMTLVQCEIFRLAYRHGLVPADFAIDRMMDTLWRSGEQLQVVAMSAQFEVAGAMGKAKELRPEDCGTLGRQADSVSGLSLEVWGPAPMRPWPPPLPVSPFMPRLPRPKA